MKWLNLIEAFLILAGVVGGLTNTAVGNVVMLFSLPAIVFVIFPLRWRLSSSQVEVASLLDREVKAEEVSIDYEGVIKMAFLLKDRDSGLYLESLVRGGSGRFTLTDPNPEAACVFSTESEAAQYARRRGWGFRAAKLYVRGPRRGDVHIRSPKVNRR